jgi:sugar (pentulose or hexulose) kinase
MTKKQIFGLIVLLVMTFFALPASAQMSDDAVIKYVNTGLSNGKTQEQLTKELILKGVSKELFDMYDSEKSLLTAIPTTLVCSGNGLRKSEIWRRIFTEDFKMTATLPKHSEEAATGACVFASVASGIFKDIKSAQNALLR